MRTPGQVLLPCPFCGEEPMRNFIEPHAHSLSLGGLRMPDHLGSVTIECGCGAGLIDDTDDAVTSRWNARAAHLSTHPPASGGVPNVWQHVKTGGVYEVIAEGMMEADGRNVVIYRATDGHPTVWVRPAGEFYDGRFKRPAAPEAPKP